MYDRFKFIDYNCGINSLLSNSTFDLFDFVTRYIVIISQFIAIISTQNINNKIKADNGNPCRIPYAFL